MKNKYFILAITFLCLLMGQSSFGQQSGGDYEDTCDVCDKRSTDYNAAECLAKTLADGDYDGSGETWMDENGKLWGEDSEGRVYADINGDGKLDHNEVIEFEDETDSSTGSTSEGSTNNSSSSSSSGGSIPSWGSGSPGLSTGGSGGDDNNDDSNDVASSDNSGNPSDGGFGPLPVTNNTGNNDYTTAENNNQSPTNSTDEPLYFGQGPNTNIDWSTFDDSSNVIEYNDTGFGNAIFSLSGNYKKTVNSSSRNIYIEMSGNSYSLNSIKVDTDNIIPYFGPDRNANNRILVDKIITYYAKKIGITADIVIDSTPYTTPNALAYSTTDEIHIAIHDDGKIDPLLSNFNNLMSVLYHEKLHLQDKKDGKTVTYRSHAEVYMKQILYGPDFSKTTYEFQRGQVGSFANYLANAISHGENVDDLIKTFNDANTDWKVTGHYSWGPGNLIYYKGNPQYATATLLSTPN